MYVRFLFVDAFETGGQFLCSAVGDASHEKPSPQSRCLLREMCVFSSEKCY